MRFLVSSFIFFIISFFIRSMFRRMLYRHFFRTLGIILFSGIIGVGTYFFCSGEYRTWKQDNGRWYCYEPIVNTHVTGWFDYKGDKYYSDTNGVMITGWQKVDEKWYYLYDNGKLAYDTVIDGYRLSVDGSWGGNN